MSLFANRNDSVIYVQNISNILKKHNWVLNMNTITNENVQNICNKLICGKPILNLLFEYGEINTAIEFMKHFHSKLNINVKDLNGENCFDKFCKHYTFSDETYVTTYTISYDKYYEVLKLMGKTTDDYLENCISKNRFNNFQTIFNKHYPSQEAINYLFSYASSTDTSTYQWAFVDMLVEHIDNISFDTFLHIICKNCKYAIEKILNKNYFDKTYINNEKILKKAIENVNVQLVKIICDNNNKLFDDVILSCIFRHWETSFCIEFFDDNNIQLKNCKITNFDTFVENIIDSRQPKTIKYVFDTLKINLNNYTHQNKISDPEIIKCLLDYGYNIGNPPTFEFDEMTDINAIYDIIGKINDSNYIQAIIISRLNNLQEMIGDLKNNV